MSREARKQGEEYGRDGQVNANSEATQASVTTLSGVGPQIAIKLAKLNLHSVQDVLFHLPHRYEDRTRITPIGSLLALTSYVVVGEVELAQVVFGRRRSLLVRISDGTGSLVLRFFYFNRNQEKAFKRGAWVRCFAEARRGANSLEFIHPEYRLFSSKPTSGLEETLTPVYPSTEGVSQLLLRKLSTQALTKLLPKVRELIDPVCLPEALRASYASTSLAKALKVLHRPPKGVPLEAMHDASSPAHQRLILEELIAHYFSLRSIRDQREQAVAPSLIADNQILNRFLQGLGFTLTGAQQRVAQEVASSLGQSKPSMRMVQGDVGSGKTVVAALALLAAVGGGHQSVMMAPTELLAEQHFRTLSEWLEPLGIEVGWLASKTPAKQKAKTLEQLASGKLLVAAGTHALIQEAVEYKKLGLVIIDEQHRFGVEQRLALRSKTPRGAAPHQLVMTATPIPRTLAMTFYADLDVSSIDELPTGRKQVNTVVVSAGSRREEVIHRVANVCQQGSQVYWVCPLIEESEQLDAQAATDTHTELAQLLPGLSIALVHGRLKAKEKDQIMTAFRSGEVDVLVATTVIEVGVDVPNASLMVVENAERMGLAQLHQLRGRVGRGSDQAYCVLMYQPPLSQHAKTRLETLRNTNDGFEIAEKDLQIRGAGELLGTKQTGSMSFKIADLIRDQALLPLIEGCAKKVEQQTPENIQPLIQRWVGSKEDYANA